MKILGVRFKNLNSLMGEWKIDFTHPEYESNGIFAITGPTGAGKTTILDAVCLGLYGRTPRLDKVTKSSNEIMSRQAGECYAEVTFETQKGRYRCHWSQHRARKRPDGELQQARHEISDADSQKVLESKINQVGALIEDATGMDFERFTRSMLLAQGGFAAFLQASPDKRAPILEQITGTEIYSRISVKVHERCREEHEKLELLQSELKGIQVLNEDEERALQTGLKEKQGREIELAGKADDMRKGLTWLDGIFALERELEGLDKMHRDFEMRRTAFEPEAKKLEKSRKALSLEGDYRGVVALRRQQGIDAKELDGATTALPEKDKACAAALTARQSAEIELNGAKTRQTTEADTIKKVRELDARLSEKKKQVEEKDKVLGASEKLAKEYKANIEKTDRALKQSQKDLEAVNDYQIKQAADAVLVTNLAAIGKVFALLLDTEAKHTKARDELAAAAGKKEAVVAECKTIETNHENLRKAFEKDRGDLKRLADEIGAILQGREISQWRSESDALRERERLLVQTNEIIERIEKTGATLNNMMAGLETSKALYVELLNEIKSFQTRKSLLEKDIEGMEAQVSLLSRIRDLEEDRKHLEDGKPCPLCGAADHPYARGNVPELNKSEAALKKTKTEFKKVSEKLGTLESVRARKEAEIQHVEKEMAEKKAALDTDEKRCEEALLKLGADFNSVTTLEARAAKVREALPGVRTKIVEAAGIIAAVEEKSKKEKSAQAALEKTRRTFDDSVKALQDAGHKLETAGLEHARLIKECDALTAEIDKARAAALKDVEPFGIVKIPSSGLEDILKDLTERKNAWEARQREKTGHEKKISDLKAGIDKDSALLGSLEKDLTARRKERSDLVTDYETLCSSRRDMFGGKSPDQEEKRLADAVEQAGKALEIARDEYMRMEKEIGALKEKIALLKGNMGRRADELAQAEQNLKERIKETGFEDEADYLSSCMAEDERQLLDEREKSLIKEKTELDARIKDRTQALAAEREKKLTDQSSEELKENLGACDAELKQTRLDIGGMLLSIAENEKLKEKQRERMKSMEARKKECGRWDDLHQLIGSSDGKKFRNFAQGLTFEMMTAHANRQLKKMTDRYLLVRDLSQPLELNVIDNYQAGEVRSTKNLSGGESFIVSLALALGLSHMASQNVRVDSLFLDEGFGTLDEDALETALETLAGLQQEGKLIGVISHVAALKERIGAQIQVIPETGGRSVLFGPGCRKI